MSTLIEFERGLYGQCWYCGSWDVSFEVVSWPGRHRVCEDCMRLHEDSVVGTVVRLPDRGER